MPYETINGIASKIFCPEEKAPWELQLKTIVFLSKLFYIDTEPEYPGEISLNDLGTLG
jgi:hypothetical protein